MEALKQARWIWYPEGNPAASAPVGTRYFLREFKIDEQKKIESARVFMTADNSFRLKVNDRYVLEGDNFHETYQADVTGFLKPAENRFEVVAENGGDAPNPAGLIGLLVIRYADGTSLDRGDGQVLAKCRRDFPARRSRPWNSARPEWPPGIGSRRNRRRNSIPRMRSWTEFYPRLELQSRLVGRRSAALHTSPRWGHRYLLRCQLSQRAAVGSLASSALSEGRFAEWWDPVTGQRFSIHPVTVSPGLVRMPTQWFVLKFAPYQSAFIVFRKTESATPLPPRSEGQFDPLADLAGPWEVSFDPAWGGPEEDHLREAGRLDCAARGRHPPLLRQGRLSQAFRPFL